jgi:uncharacterized iron-regulated membrane protein
MRRLHLIVAAVTSLAAIFVGATGSVLVFREELESALYEPRLLSAREVAVPRPLAGQMASAQAIAPERRVALVVLPSASDRPTEFILQKRGARTLKEADQMAVYVNPFTAEVMSYDRREARVIGPLRDFHFALMAGSKGLTANGWIGLALVFLSLTGLVLWTQSSPKGHRLTMNFRGNWKKNIWDLHRVAGAWSLALLALVSITGSYYAFRETFLKGIFAATGSLPPRGSPPVSLDPGESLASIDDLARAAETAVPGARLAVLRVPPSPAAAWVATLHRPGDEGESVDSGVSAYLHPATGAILRVDDTSLMPFGARLVKAIEPTHFGKFGGLPIKLLWFALGLAPLFFAVTGGLMWWNRYAGAKRAREIPINRRSSPPSRAT